MTNSAFSSDGYIIDQSHTKELPYGRFSSDWNGCGWIAVYNFLHALGCPDDFMQINREMDSILPYRGAMGTPIRTVMQFLLGRRVAVKKVSGKRPALEACRNARAGILRYIEGREPHYVAFVRVADDSYRFFNAVEGDENHICAAEDFFAGHIKLPSVRVIFIS